MARATAADAELAEHRIDGALIRVAPDGTLSWRSLHGAHPLQVLVGFVAPPEWAAIGVSNAGWAHASVAFAPILPNRRKSHN